MCIQIRFEIAYKIKIIVADYPDTTEKLPSNPRRKDGMGISDINVEGKMVPSIQLGTPHMATIMILDDDHGGIFQACTLLWAFTFPKQLISSAN